MVPLAFILYGCVIWMFKQISKDTDEHKFTIVGTVAIILLWAIVDDCEVSRLYFLRHRPSWLCSPWMDWLWQKRFLLVWRKKRSQKCHFLTAGIMKRKSMTHMVYPTIGTSKATALIWMKLSTVLIAEKKWLMAPATQAVKFTRPTGSATLFAKTATT